MRARAAVVALSAGSIVLAGCAGSGPKPTAHYTTPPETTPGVSLASPRVQQIQLARASNRLFSIFPASPGKTKCGIPEGGVHFKPLPGICMTSIHPDRATHEPALIVTFIEKWNDGCPQTSDAGPCAPATHRWQIIEGEPVITTTARLRVLATRSSGATAPQYYK